MISRAVEAEILRLYQVEGWPKGTIARQLHMHHDTVRRVLCQSGIAVPECARICMIDPYLPFIQETFARYPTLRASRLYQMVRERGYLGSADHFRHMVARWRPRPCDGSDRRANRARSTGRTSASSPSAARSAH
jgi:hypothetical protein